MRRADPERTYLAQRAGIYQRLVDGERLTARDAEHWIVRWEREAEVCGRVRSTGFWDDGWNWISDERSRARRARIR